MAVHAFNVYENGKLINTVFYGNAEPPEEVKRSLVNHDGYSPSITVRRSLKHSDKKRER